MSDFLRMPISSTSPSQARALSEYKGPFPPFTQVVELFKGDLSHVIPNTNRPLEESREYLLQELATTTLDDVLHHLWIAGLPRSYKMLRPLHRQKVIGRQIVLVEQVGLHLVSRDDTIFIKPIPKCLLNYKFYEEHISSRADTNTRRTYEEAERMQAYAIGFLSSYVELIRFESDFDIAKDLRLVPSSIQWNDWLAFSGQVNAHVTRSPLRTRYDFGELRLDRLNLIMAVFRGKLTRPYITIETTYSAYFKSFHPVLIALVLGFVLVALSAFQVAIAVEGPQAVTSVGYGFAMMTLGIMSVILVAPFIWFGILFVDNLLFALRGKEKRSSQV